VDSKPVHFGGLDAESGVAHSQRTGDVLGEVTIQRHAGHRFHDPSQDVRRHPILECRAWLVRQRQLRQFGHHLGIRLLVIDQVRRAIGTLYQRIAELTVRETGRVTHQVVHRHGAAAGLQRQSALTRIGVDVFHADLDIAQLRHMAPHRIREQQLAALHQHQRSHHRQGLGHGRNAKNTAPLHGPQQLAVGVAERLEVSQRAVACDQHRGPGNRRTGGVGLQHLAEPRQPVR
jgi:hypothetical protein